LQTFVIYPPDFDPQQTYPLILQVHGGPSASYGGNFSYRFQRYAAEGFVVVAPNYRGSQGTDMGFYQQAEHWVFPNLEYDDVLAAMAAVQAVVRIDPQRLYVTGQSAGGLMSAWMIGKTDRFAAAIVTAPVINYVSHFLTHDLYSSYVGRYFAKLPWEDLDAHWARSPLSQVANVTTPTLIIQGDRDSRTPLSEGLQLYHALKLLDVPSALLILPGAFHSPTKPVQLIEEHQHMQRWFQRHEKPI
jgi:dipeptidyl aminopeptidase/acylaminoacyl peptidase